MAKQPEKPAAPPASQPTLREGDPAPMFTLPSSTGAPISLADYRGKQNVVLYFYPKDDTPGCTIEACGFRDTIGDYRRAGAAVLGVSLDNMTSHLKFVDKFSLPFPLVSDEQHEVSDAYGVYKLKQMYGREYWGIERTTFLIDTRGKIAKIYPKVKVDDHHYQVLKDLKALSR
ncbi:MAG: thioredoxin-dependent thiol peroxidase [Nitrospirae bacterium]|nr:thioredoxin-dependent thiol peroxidase [Nitrospirota bacterium]